MCLSTPVVRSSKRSTSRNHGERPERHHHAHSRELLRLALRHCSVKKGARPRRDQCHWRFRPPQQHTRPANSTPQRSTWRRLRPRHPRGQRPRRSLVRASWCPTRTRQAYLEGVGRPREEQPTQPHGQFGSSAVIPKTIEVS